jgi:hypothetical protein
LTFCSKQNPQPSHLLGNRRLPHLIPKLGGQVVGMILSRI